MKHILGKALCRSSYNGMDVTYIRVTYFCFSNHSELYQQTTFILV